MWNGVNVQQIEAAGVGGGAAEARGRKWVFSGLWSRVGMDECE